MLHEVIKKGDPLFLAGDIGGTKTHLGLYTLIDTELTLVRETKVASKDWQDLASLIKGFLKENALEPENITAGCLSLAGPISHGKCLLTNLDRLIDFKIFQGNLNFQNPVLFVNDLAAMGHGLMLLENEDLLCLNPSVVASIADNSFAHTNSPLNRALIAPGTGLGETMILADNRVYPTEAAHADFAPRSEKEVRLWRFLAQKYGHVSYERIISGPGLENIYEFLCQESVHYPQPTLTASEITKRALDGICPLCTETLVLFVKILGAEAGNLALRTLAYGGVYLGGGIPAKILSKLQEKAFLEAFVAKGRMKMLLSQVPIYVILNERTALLGAARLAVASE